MKLVIIKIIYFSIYLKKRKLHGSTLKLLFNFFCKKNIIQISYIIYYYIIKFDKILKIISGKISITMFLCKTGITF